MVNVNKMLLAGVIALAPVAGTAATVTIDNFTTLQEAASPSGGTSPTFLAAPAGAIGDRTLTAIGDGEPAGGPTTDVASGFGFGSVSNGSGIDGTGQFDWAAGGFDLTDGGTNDTFVLEVVDVDLDVAFALTIDGVTSTSTSTSTTGNVLFDFAAFGDLSNAMNISLLVSGPTSFDATFSLLGAEDLVANPVATVPLPAGGLLLGSLLLGGGFAARRKAKAKS